MTLSRLKIFTVFDMVNDVVSPEDFYRGDHRRIYEHIVQLISQGRPADVLTVHDSMAAVGLGQEGTKSFLNSLAMNTPNSANARRYAEIVRDRSILRSLVNVGSQIVDSALDTKGMETKDILDRAESSIFKISEDAQVAGAGLKPVKGVYFQNQWRRSGCRGRIKACEGRIGRGFWTNHETL